MGTRKDRIFGGRPLLEKGVSKSDVLAAVAPFLVDPDKVVAAIIY